MKRILLTAALLAVLPAQSQTPVAAASPQTGCAGLLFVQGAGEAPCMTPSLEALNIRYVRGSVLPSHEELVQGRVTASLLPDIDLKTLRWPVGPDAEEPTNDSPR